MRSVALNFAQWNVRNNPSFTSFTANFIHRVQVLSSVTLCRSLGNILNFLSVESEHEIFGRPYRNYACLTLNHTTWIKVLRKTKIIRESPLWSLVINEISEQQGTYGQKWPFCFAHCWGQTGLRSICLVLLLFCSVLSTVSFMVAASLVCIPLPLANPMLETRREVFTLAAIKGNHVSRKKEEYQ